MRTKLALKEKLFRLATKYRNKNTHPQIRLPDSISPIDANTLFSGNGSEKRILELGAGWGEFCVEWMKSHPDHSYVAFEIKWDRIKQIIKQTEIFQLAQLRIVPINFNWFLEEILPQRAFDRVIINFPDPWPKKRHWKHRLVNSHFPDRIKKILRENGTVFLATDYGPYARKILSTFRNRDDFEPVYPWPHYSRFAPADHPKTRFETIHLNDGRSPYYQEWRLISGKS